MEIFFCEACGRRISDAELDRGEGRKVGNLAWCAGCVDQAPAAEPAALRRPLTPTKRRPPTGAGRRPPTGSRPAVGARGGSRARWVHPPSGSGPVLLAVLGLFGIGIGLAVGALVLRRGGGEEDASRPPRGARSPTERGRKKPLAKRPAAAPKATSSSPTERAPAPKAVTPTPPPPPPPAPAAREQVSKETGAATGPDMFAQIGLDAALGYARAKPDDIRGQVERLESVCRNHPGTAAARRAEERAKELRRDHPDQFRSEVKVEPFRLPEVERITCPRRAGAVTIDGRLDEWKDLPHECRTPQLIKIKKESWTGPRDCSFRFAVEYDDQYLYIAVESTDDVFYQETPETWPWEQDGIEIRVDARPDPPRSLGRGRTEHTTHTFISLSPSRSPQDVYACQPEKWYAGTRAVCVKTEKGHNTEVALPVSYLNEKQRRRWQEFRFNVAVDDYDPLPDGGKVGAQIWWRPDWRTDSNVPGSGTFSRR